MSRLSAVERTQFACGALVGLGTLFLGFGVFGLLDAAGVKMLTLALVLLAADLVVAGALLTRWQLVRPVAQGLAIFGLLVHLLVLLHRGPLWLRGCSTLLVVAHGYALALLSRMSAEEPDPEEPDERLESAASMASAESAASADRAAHPDQSTDQPADPVSDQPAAVREPDLAHRLDAQPGPDAEPGRDPDTGDGYLTPLEERVR